MPLRLFAFLAAIVISACAAPPPAIAAFETPARAAYLYDMDTETVLVAKNADEALPPASMSKLMTLYMLFEALEQGRVQKDTPFVVSTKAKNMGGSTMFLNELDQPTAEELIQGVIVSSGNDATVVIAEGLAGSEETFARQMTEKAREMGMTNSNFANASGWPHPEHRMSVRDLGILATRLIEDFPVLYEYFAQEEFDYEGRAPANRFNRNPLLGLDIGADGLKTGHTQEAGYGLVGSVEQDGRRLVFVVTGLESTAARRQESVAITNWGFRQFLPRDVASAGDVILEAPVWMGDAQSVNLVAADDIRLLVPAIDEDSLTTEVVYSSPLEAPIAAGQTVGELVVNAKDMPERRIPLVAETEIARGGFVPRLRSSATVLFDKAMMQVQTLME